MAAVSVKRPIKQREVVLTSEWFRTCKPVVMASTATAEGDLRPSTICEQKYRTKDKCNCLSAYDHY